MKISVIVAIYNCENYLTRCVESILNQTHSNLEIILVNDGSTDKSLDVIEQFAAKDNRIKIIDKENGGQSTARNIGLDIATGDYIAFVDADDYIEFNMFAVMMSAIINSNADICICGINYIYKDKFMKLQPENYDTFESSLTDKLMSSPCNKLYKKSIISDVRFPNNLKYEDLHFNMIVYAKSSTIKRIDDVLYNYDRTNENGTINTIGNRVGDIVKILHMANDFYDKNDCKNKFYDELEFINIYSTIVTKIGIVFKNKKLRKIIIKDFMELLDSEFPKWYKNKYIKKLSLKQRFLIILTRTYYKEVM